MSIRRKLAIGLGTALLTWYAVLPPCVEMYVKNLVPKCIAAQEQKLGIKYNKIPKLNFKSSSIVETLQTVLTNASYNSEKDYILVNNPLLFALFGGKKTIDHELGHFYTDHLSKELGRKNWLQYDKKNPMTNTINMVISEGIGKYFGNIMNDDTTDTFSDKDWPDSITPNRMSQTFGEKNIIYEGGYHIVKPIIDRYKQKGIEYLICNPPQIKSLKELRNYQLKALVALAKQEKKEQRHLSH